MGQQKKGLEFKIASLSVMFFTVQSRAQELCKTKSRIERPAVAAPKSPYSLCGHKVQLYTLYHITRRQERERERERQRQRETETDRQTDRETENLTLYRFTD